MRRPLLRRRTADPPAPAARGSLPTARAPVRCPACLTRAPAPRVERVGPYTLHACPACELTFSQPMRAADGGFYEANAAYEDRWEFSWVAHRLRESGLGGAALDIGCGDGRFLARLAGRFTLTGLDVNPAAVRHARGERGLADVHALPLEEFVRRGPPRRYDVITAFHVLEHVADPDGLLACMAACLRPGGVLALAVPNPGRWARRRCREQWDEPPHHLTRWTPRALRTLLGRHGFEVREQRVEPMRTLRQVHSAWCDLLWEVWRKVAPRVRLGWALQPVPGTRRAPVAFRLRGLALRAIAWLAVVPALVMYPRVRCGQWGAYQGKGLVIIAAAAATDSRGAGTTPNRAVADSESA